MKKQQIKVSVILPIYNVELYLRECMDSIVNQTLKNIEIICVDDGSTDNSLNIIKEYAKKDKRIIILEQENQGAGVARNTGLDIAKGEYLSFLDPDDFFELTFLNDCYNKAIETNVDIIICESNTYDDLKKVFLNKVSSYPNGIQKINLPQPNKEIFSYEDMPDTIFNTFQTNVWTKLFKTSFVRENNIKFQPLFRTNDWYFASITLVLANKITIINKVLVYYRVGTKTSSQATLYSHPLDFYKAGIAIKNKLLELNYFKYVEKSFLIALVSMVNHNLNSQKKYETYKIVYEYLVENLNKDFQLLEKDVSLNFKTNLKLMLEYTVDEYLELKEKYFIDENDTSIKISVVIPVYNVEKYLRECLDSVINQTLENIEIICINDGSTDNSINILREYASKDSRIIMLNQSNRGLSATRNKGIQVAKGKYIYFLDSDDMLVPYALERMYEEVATNNLDMAFFSAKIFFDSYEIEKNFKYMDRHFKSSDYLTNDVLSGANMFEKMIKNASYRVSSCFNISKIEFLKGENIWFKEGILHEDNLFLFKTLLVAGRVKHFKDELYLRRVRNDSIMTQGKSFKNFYGYLICYIEMLDYSNKFEYTDNVENAVITTLNGVYNAVIRDFKQLPQSEKDKVNQLTKLERYYFDTFFLPQIQVNTNVSSSINYGNSVVKSIAGNKEFNKIKGQLRWARGELAKVRKERLGYKKDLNKIKYTFSYKLGRFITFVPRQIRYVFSKKKLENEVEEILVLDTPIKKDYDYYKNLSPEFYESELKEWFHRNTGKTLNLDNPQTFNEKVQWLKLYDSTPLKTKLADKYLVSEWVANKIGKEYLIPLLGVWDNFDEIDFDLLPNQFALKTNHGCGWNYIVKDKSKFDKYDAKKKFDEWMKLNFAFKNGFELHYMNIKPKIIAEQYIQNVDQLYDYKFMCFNGKVVFMWVCSFRDENLKRTIFEPNFNLANFSFNNSTIDNNVIKPINFDKMIELSQKLSKGFVCVRVDFYEIDRQLYFGEMTFTSESGTSKFLPSEYDRILGDMIELPKKKHKIPKRNNF